MVSGKGGVGKTSLSASLAVRLAGAGHNTLVVSTDPAHSLSDSLAQDVSGGRPVPVEGTDLPLWGLEVDPEAASASLRAGAGSNDGQGIRDFLGGFGLGALADQLADLRLGELLDTPPPGLDEAVAIAKVVEIAEAAEYARFSRVVIDTAPTGHTLRLLGVPAFVDAALAKVVRLRKKLGAAGTAVRSLFGAGETQDEAVAKLERLRAQVRLAGDLFRNADSTEFVIATIPTELAVAESARLLAALRADGVPVKRVVVNQVIGEGDGEAFLRTRQRDQAAALAGLEADPVLAALPSARAPLLDLEVRGVPALRYFGGLAWGGLADAAAPPRPDGGRRYVMLGGKGGVGKTSLSAALATHFADQGYATLVVSTDPAHSLSDSLAQDVSGGSPVRVEGTDLPLWGMEVDVAAAAADVRAAAAASAPGAGDSKVMSFMKSVGLGAFAEQLADLRLGELLDTLPPGVDEAVAIAKVVDLARSDTYAHFDRIVFDTAPTGHTLRLLTLPDFVDATLGKVVRLRQKLTDAADAVKGLFGAAKSAPDPAVVAMDALRARMDGARALFRDAATTSFVIVSIPTVMATSESGRLARALRAEAVPIGGLIVNQVLADGAAPAFLATRRAEQRRVLAGLGARLPGVQVIEAPVVDLEVRGVPALSYFGSKAWRAGDEDEGVGGKGGEQAGVANE
jgi:arsenite-transporting ATPase